MTSSRPHRTFGNLIPENTLVAWSRLLGLAVVYAIVARLVLTVTMAEGNVTIFWLPGGIALAATLTWGIRALPAVFCGALAAGLMVDDPLWVSGLLALGNTLETFAAYRLLRRIPSFSDRLETPLDFVRLSLVAIASAISSALIGPSTLLAACYLTWQNLGYTIVHWWQADVLGMVLASPLLLVWRERPQGWFSPQRIVETTSLIALSTLI